MSRRLRWESSAISSPEDKLDNHISQVSISNGEYMSETGRDRLPSRGSATLVLLLPLLITASHISTQGAAAQGPTSVGVWSDTCHSWNITLANPSCGNLAVGSQFSVEVNVTNAPTFNAYEFSLYFDSRFLQFNSSDTRTGTVFAAPFTVKESAGTPGTYKLVVVDAPGNNTAASGTLCHLKFNIIGVGVSPLVLGAGISKPSDYASEYSWTRLDLGATPLEVITANGYFKSEPSKLGPIASFTFSPATPILSQSVSFDATTSFDPDDTTGMGIRRYLWDFGEGYVQDTSTPIATHIFNFTGNFSVRLTVFDFDDGFQGMLAMRVGIEVHDLAVKLDVHPTITTIGTPVSISITVANIGFFPETFDLNVGYKPPGATIGSLTGRALQPGQSSAFNFTLSTSGISPGQYDIVANLTDPLDQNPANNAATVHITVESFPMASFSYFPANPSVGDIVYFNGSSSNSPNGATVQWDWTWGDGLIQSHGSQTTWHIYVKAGVYTVNLSVTDVTGNKGSTNVTLTVSAVPGKVQHSPIIINGNNGFNASSGVHQGTGTASDPYVIEGWQIDSSNATGVTISNTDVYFSIRNIIVTSTASSNVLGYAGIQLTKVANGRIEASTMVTNVLANPRVSITNSENVTVSNNKMLGFSTGISCQNSSTINISGNTISNSDSEGLYLVQSSRVNISGNIFSQDLLGMNVQGSTHVSITGNNITSNMLDGMLLSTTTRVPYVLTEFVTISSNIISKNDLDYRGIDPRLSGGSGIFLRYAQNVTIFANDFLHNRVQAIALRSSDALQDSWDDGYPGAGNYWSDYGAVDKCAGPSQNICTGSDGIGDTPYNITDTTGMKTGVDRYPLMGPASLESDFFPPSWSSGTQLKVSGLGQTSLILAWSSALDDNRVTQYRVYKDSTLLATLAGYVYNYNVTGLSPGTSYTFKVEAGDVADNWSTTGPSISVTTLAQPGPSSTPPGSPGPVQQSTFWEQYWWIVTIAVVVAVAGTTATFLRRQRQSKCKTRA